jgi:hypothetical protein
MARTLSLVLAGLLAIGSGSAAECSRKELASSADLFFHAAHHRLSIPVVSGYKVSENGVFKSSIADTITYNITGFNKPFKIQAIDTDSCEVATYVVVNEKQTHDPVLFSFRLKLSGPGGKATEIEILNTEKANYTGFFFAPENLPKQALPYWTSTQTTNSSVKPLTRDELIAIPNAYAEGIQLGSGKDVSADVPCPRYENGFQTVKQCNAEFDTLKFPVYSRRWVADTLTGVVMGAYYFEVKPYGLWTQEFFKVEDGKIKEVQANWIPAIYGSEDVWPGGTDNVVFPSPLPTAGATPS